MFRNPAQCAQNSVLSGNISTMQKSMHNSKTDKIESIRSKRDSNEARTTVETRSHTKGLDVLRAHPANLWDAAGNICPKLFFLERQITPKKSESALPTPKAVKQLFLFFSEKKYGKHPTTTKETRQKDDAGQKMMHPAKAQL